jgi:hypothetical protein
LGSELIGHAAFFHRRSALARPRSHTASRILCFGRRGHQIGEFTHAHTMAVDSKGNLYIAETDWGRRVQRFKLVNGN